MTVEIDKIAECLLPKKLITEALVQPKIRMTGTSLQTEPDFTQPCERCAVGELLHCVGVSDKRMYETEMKESNTTTMYCQFIFNNFEKELAFYGITSTEQLRIIINLNDEEYGEWLQDQENNAYDGDPFKNFVAPKTRAEFIVEELRTRV